MAAIYHPQDRSVVVSNQLQHPAILATYAVKELQYVDDRQGGITAPTCTAVETAGWNRAQDFMAWFSRAFGPPDVQTMTGLMDLPAWQQVRLPTPMNAAISCAWDLSTSN